LSPKIKDNRVGEISLNTYKSKMTIIKYSGRNNVLVKFDNGYEIETRYSRFKSGEVENPYDKSTYSIGYLGEGIYNNNGIVKPYKKQYDTWHRMLQRCYDENYQDTRPTYIGCTVCEEWHNFQNFAKWYDENFYEIEDHRMELDKDILFKGNKVYSPETCVFVPNRINSLFIKSNASRGEFPIGVSFVKKRSTYVASCCDNGKGKKLGEYDSPELAFEIYKDYKEKLIKRIAEEYKNIIPYKLYDALYKYEVEITD